MCDIAETGSNISLSGNLTMETVQTVFDRTPKFDLKSYTVDLQDLKNVDSAGLALLIYWQGRAKDRNCQLHFVNASEKLRQIAKLSGIESLSQA